MEDLSLAVVIIVSVVACLTLFAIQRAHVRRLTERLLQQEEQRTKLQSEMTVLLDCTKGIGDRLQKQQSQLKNLQEQNKQRVVPEPPVSGLRPYQKAEVLFRTGTPMKDVMTTCGLSRGDAEFIQHVSELRAQPKDDLLSVPELLRERNRAPLDDRKKSYERESRRVSEPPSGQ